VQEGVAPSRCEVEGDRSPPVPTVVAPMVRVRLKIC